MSIFETTKTIEIAVANGLRDLSAGLDTAAGISTRIAAAYGARAQAIFDALAPLVGTGLPPSLIPQVGKTAAVSLLATGPTPFDFPLIAGKRPVLCFGAFVVTARVGAATGNLVWQVGTNSPNFDNMIAAHTTAAAAFNAATFAVPFMMPIAIDPTVGGMPTMDAQPNLRISTALGGATTLQGRLGLQVLYV